MSFTDTVYTTTITQSSIIQDDNIYDILNDRKKLGAIIKK